MLPSFQEDHVSQVPALQLLQNLGYTYLRPQEAFLERKGKLGNVLLEDILSEGNLSISHFIVIGICHRVFQFPTLLFSVKTISSNFSRKY